MMKSAYTPGPWRVGTGHAANVIFCASGKPVVSACSDFGGRAENLRLVAAAPELLRLLAYILRSGIGRQVLCNLADGIGTRHADGEAFMAAANLVKELGADIPSPPPGFDSWQDWANAPGPGPLEQRVQA